MGWFLQNWPWQESIIPTNDNGTVVLESHSYCDYLKLCVGELLMIGQKSTGKLFQSPDVERHCMLLLWEDSNLNAENSVSWPPGDPIKLLTDGYLVRGRNPSISLNSHGTIVESPLRQLSFCLGHLSNARIELGIGRESRVHNVGEYPSQPSYYMNREK